MAKIDGDLQIAGGMVVSGVGSISTLSVNSLSVATLTVSNLSVSTLNAIATLYATSNTTQSSTGTQNVSSLIFAGAGIASIGVTNGSVVVSVPAGGGAGDGGNVIAAGTRTATSLGNVTFSNSNGLTFGLDANGGQTVTASMDAIRSISAGTRTATGSQIVFSNSNNLEFGVATNDSVLTARWVPVSSTAVYPDVSSGTAVLSFLTNTSGSASLWPFYIPDPVAAGWAGIPLSVSFITGGTSTFSDFHSIQFGIYSRGTGTQSSRLSLMTDLATTATYGVTYNNSTISISGPNTTAASGYAQAQTTSAGLNLSSLYTGIKMFHFPLGGTAGVPNGGTLSAGQYWVGLWVRKSTLGGQSGLRFSIQGQNVAGLVTGMGVMGSNSSAFTNGTNLVGGMGGGLSTPFGVQTSGAGQDLQNSYAISDFTQNVSVRPMLILQSTA